MKKIKRNTFPRMALIFCVLILTQIVSAMSQSNLNVENFEKNNSIDKKLTSDSVLINGFAKLILVESSSTENDICYIIKVQGLKPLYLRKSIYESSGKGLLSEYFSDDIILSEKILKGIFKFADLERVVAEYNTWRRSIDRITNDIK